jgi:hypothetical protein
MWQGRSPAETTNTAAEIQNNAMLNLLNLSPIVAVCGAPQRHVAADWMMP